MDKPVQRFPINSRVRLLRGVEDGFYGSYGRIGNEGWVRRVKFDKFGYPHILVEWDKDHWSYNGVQDLWTWEAHFDKVEDMTAQENPQDDPDLQFALRIARAMRAESDIEELNDDLGPEAQATQEEEEWDLRTDEAANIVKNSKAFMVIALGDEGDGDTIHLYPRLLHGAQDERLELIIHSQVSQVAATFHENLAAEQLNRLNAE